MICVGCWPGSIAPVAVLGRPSLGQTRGQSSKNSSALRTSSRIRLAERRLRHNVQRLQLFRFKSEPPVFRRLHRMDPNLQIDAHVAEISLASRRDALCVAHAVGVRHRHATAVRAGAELEWPGHRGGASILQGMLRNRRARGGRSFRPGRAPAPLRLQTPRRGIRCGGWCVPEAILERRSVRKSRCCSPYSKGLKIGGAIKLDAATDPSPYLRLEDLGWAGCGSIDRRVSTLSQTARPLPRKWPR